MKGYGAGVKVGCSYVPRQLGMLEARGHMLPLWEDVLPPVPDKEADAAARRVAAAM